MKKIIKAKTSCIVLFKSLALIWKISKKTLIIMFFASIANGVALPISLLLSKNFLDFLALDFSLGKLSITPIIWLLAALVLQLLNNIINQCTSSMQAFFSENLANRITDILLAKIIVLPMSFFDDETIYNKLRLALSETPQRCSMIIQSIVRLFSNTIQISAIITIVLSLDWLIMLACVITAVPLFFINSSISKFWFKISQSRSEGYRKSDVIKDILIKNDNIKEIKLFGIGKLLKDDIVNLSDKFAKENKSHRSKIAMINVFVFSAKSIISFLLKLQTVLLSISRKTTIGTVTMFLSAIDTFQNTIADILLEFSLLYEHALYIQYMFDIQDITEDESNDLGKIAIEQIQEIRFTNVYFKYPKSQTYALKNVSLTLKKNCSYALVGLNGSGKSTLIKLILKLYTPSSGCITVNGIDIDKIDAFSLRKNMSAVFQDFIRFPFTIEKNVKLGDISNNENSQLFKKAIEYSGASEFIHSLPDKEYTQLQREWTEGTELSGGQWQKLAIARGIYRDKDVVIFDEPFSSLDVLSEESIIQKLKETKTNKLLLFVTHRYSSISLADEIIVLNAGELVENGTHKNLMSKKGLYHKVYSAQANHLKDC